MVGAALVAVTMLGSCAHSRQAGGSASSPAPAPSGPDRSALVRSIGQECTWYGGLQVTVLSVTRRDRDAPAGQAGYVVAVRVVNHTPKGFATGGLTMQLWLGGAQAPATGDDRGALGRGCRIRSWRPASGCPATTGSPSPGVGRRRRWRWG
ncbi:hypothetical protein [Actinocatenispora thailandica]|uniref:hypothetical protein n=1 Tax=Actinocatenispora thailandica TaxID=227318 RepID=UPI00194E6DD3|nr:hypothetical protein [Actinocatenispora thailandica]